VEAAVQPLENRCLLSNNSVFTFQAPQPVTLASDDAQSYTTWNYGDNGGTGLGPATFLEGSGGSIFLATGGTSIDGGKSFDIRGGTLGQAMTRSILAPTSQAEYTVSATFNEDNTNGFDGFNIKSAPGTKFADNELVSFGLSNTGGDFSVVVSGAIDQTIDLGFTSFTSLVNSTIDFDLVYDTNAGSFTLGAKLHSDASFTTVSGSLKSAGNTATTLGFSAMNTGNNQDMIFDDLKITTLPTAYRVQEDALFAQVFVTRTGDNLNTPFNVDYTTVDGTAIAGTDYVTTMGTLTFASGDSTPQAIIIPIIDNHRIDGDRSFFVQLTNVTSGFQTNPPNVVLDASPATVTIHDNDLGFQLSQATYGFQNNQTATFTVQREGITQGAASVNWSTLHGTATPGVDYGTFGNGWEVSGTVNFADGQASATFTVPLIQSSFTGGRNFSVVLSGGTSGLNVPNATPLVDAFVTGTSTATVALTSADTTPPTVIGVHLIGPKSSIKSVRVDFSEALIQAQAESTTSYALYAVQNDSRFGSGARSKVKLRSASYDAASHTVTLVPAQPLGTGRSYQLVVIGAPNAGVTDLALNHVHGDATDANVAHNFSTYFARGSSITYTDHNGDRVHLNLRKGYMDLVRNSQGDATLLLLQQTVPGTSALSGTVMQHGPDADGVTTIDTISGATGVSDLLHHPPFNVTTIN